MILQIGEEARHRRVEVGRERQEQHQHLLVAHPEGAFQAHEREVRRQRGLRVADLGGALDVGDRHELERVQQDVRLDLLAQAGFDLGRRNRCAREARFGGRELAGLLHAAQVSLQQGAQVVELGSEVAERELVGAEALHRGRHCQKRAGPASGAVADGADRRRQA